MNSWWARVWKFCRRLRKTLQSFKLHKNNRLRVPMNKKKRMRNKTNRVLLRQITNQRLKLDWLQTRIATKQTVSVWVWTKLRQIRCTQSSIRHLIKMQNSEAMIISIAIWLQHPSKTITNCLSPQIVWHRHWCPINEDSSLQVAQRPSSWERRTLLNSVYASTKKNTWFQATNQGFRRPYLKDRRVSSKTG